MYYFRNIGYTIAAGLTALYLGCATAPERREEQKPEQKPRQQYRVADLLQDNPSVNVPATTGCTNNAGRSRALCVKKSFLENLLKTADERLFKP